MSTTLHITLTGTRSREMERFQFSVDLLRADSTIASWVSDFPNPWVSVSPVNPHLSKHAVDIDGRTVRVLVTHPTSRARSLDSLLGDPFAGVFPKGAYSTNSIYVTVYPAPPPPPPSQPTPSPLGAYLSELSTAYFARFPADEYRDTPLYHLLNLVGRVDGEVWSGVARAVSRMSAMDKETEQGRWIAMYVGVVRE